MARREKDVDMPRRGNFKGGMGQTSVTGGAKPKKTSGIATTEAVKKMKQKESSMAKPKPKPSKPAAAKSGATYGDPKSKVRNNGATTRSLNGLSPIERAALARSQTSGKAFIGARSRRAKSEVKEPTRSLSPKAQPSSIRLGVKGMSKLSPTARASLARSRSSMDARENALALKYKREKQKKPQSRSGEMVLGGGPDTPQAAKIRKSQEPKTTVKAKTKSRYGRRKTSSAKSSTVGDLFRRNFGTASMRNK